MRRMAAALVPVIVLAGCSTSGGPGKPIEPAKAAGLVAVTHAAIEAPISNFARVSIPDGALLIGAKLDGHLAFCTTSPAYYANYDKSRGVCFIDQHSSGRFNAFRINGLDQQFTLATPVSYSVENAKGLSAAAVAECDDVAFAAWMRDPRLRAVARMHCLRDAIRAR